MSAQPAGAAARLHALLYAPASHQAALTGCAALTGVGAVLNRARVEAGSSVLVVGAGGVGQFCVQGVRIAGAERIVAVDPVEGRREQALRLGASEVAMPEDLGDETFDYAFDPLDDVNAAIEASLAGSPRRVLVKPYEPSDEEESIDGRT